MNDLRLVFREEVTSDLQRPDVFNGEIIPGNFTKTETWDFLKWNETEEYSTITITTGTNANFLIKIVQNSPACVMFNIVLTNCPETYNCDMKLDIINSNELLNATRTISHKFTFKRPSFDARVTIRFMKFTEEDGFINSDSLRVRFTFSHEDNPQPKKRNKVQNKIPSNYITPLSSQNIIPQTSSSSHSEDEYDIETEEYCGIRNQGATCYINSILQTLFHIPAFRRLIFEVNCENIDENYEKTIIWNLQRLFAQMQTKREPVTTKLLTNSFGWSNDDIFHQQDTHEFLLEFLSIIEKKLKTTPENNPIANLFQGKLRATIKCINVDFTSSNIEEFFTIPLDVKDCSSLEESLSRFTAPEPMEGSNQYKAEGYGFQDAILTTELAFLPPVLFFQLRRFEYDSKIKQKVKINSKLTFPLNLNMNSYMPTEARKENDENLYELFGVLAHAGNVENGHFYVFLRTSPDDQEWFKFNDSIVSKVSKKLAVEDNFGKSEQNDRPLNTEEDDDVDKSPTSSSSIMMSPSSSAIDDNGSEIEKFENFNYSAYMLVYMQHTKLKELFCKVPDSLIPKSSLTEVSDVNIQNNILEVKIFTDESIDSNKMTFSDPLKFEIRKNKTMVDLYEKVINLLKVKFLRLHFFFNSSILGRVACRSNIKVSTLCTSTFFAETSEDSPLNVYDDDIMLFIQFFSPLFKPFPIKFIERVSLKRSQPIATVIPLVEKKINLPPSQHLIAFALIDSNLIEIDIFKASDQLMLPDGTFVIFQILPQFKQPRPPLNIGEFGIEARYFDIFTEKVPKLVSDYYQMVKSLINFTMICPLKNIQKVEVPSTIDFHSFKQFISRIFKVEVKSARSVLALYSGNSIKPLDEGQFKTIGEAIHENDQITVCSIDKRNLFLRVILSFSCDAIQMDFILLKFFPIGATVKDVILYIKSKNKIPDDILLRALSIKGAKVGKILDNDLSLENLKNPIRVEVIPDDQKELLDNSFLARFEKVTLEKEEIVPFGMPFLFKVIPDEKFKLTKKRLFDTIGVPEKIQNQVRFLFDTESEDDDNDEEEDKEEVEISDDMVLADNPKTKTQIAVLFPPMQCEHQKEKGVKLYD